jgi:hypothetical protein
MMAVMRTFVLMAVWTMALGGPLGAQSRAVSGQAGILGEWELTATVTEQADGGGRLWSGPLSLKHVGYCSVDVPEEKTGELRLRISGPPGEATATLLIDREVCTFSGKFKESYDGIMHCPGRRGVPMMLWFQ